MEPNVTTTRMQPAARFCLHFSCPQFDMFLSVVHGATRRNKGDVKAAEAAAAEHAAAVGLGAALAEKREKVGKHLRASASVVMSVYMCSPFLIFHHSITDFEINALLNQDSYRLLKFVSDKVLIFDTC